jgi:hypothetical protein
MLGLNLTLSLSRQAMMADHRQRAARMSRDELNQLADELIQRCHQQEHMIAELQRAAANLMVQSALDGAPAFGAVSDEHRQMAREVLGMKQGCREGWAQRVMRPHLLRAARLGRDELALRMLGR